MDAVFIYRDRSGSRFYDASTGEMHGGPEKVIAYVNGFLCAMDREAKIAIPVSRWKLAEIGFACVLAALKGRGGAASDLDKPTPQPEALSAPPAEATESFEAQWERLMQEMRDLSR